MRPPQSVNREHAYEQLSLLKLIAPIVSALVAEDRSKRRRTLEELEATTRALAEHAQALAAELWDFHLERLEAQPRERLQRQIAQEVARLLAREWLRNGGSRIGTLKDVVRIAKGLFLSLPGSRASPRFVPLGRDSTELQVAWLQALTRVTEAAWVAAGCGLGDARNPPEVHPETLVQRTAGHLSRAVREVVEELTSGEEDPEVVLRVEQSVLGQISRGYARILESHPQAIEQRLDEYYCCLRNVWRDIGRGALRSATPAGPPFAHDEPVPMI